MVLILIEELVISLYFPKQFYCMTLSENYISFYIYHLSIDSNYSQ